MKNSSSKFQLVVLAITIICAAVQWFVNNNAPVPFRLQSGFLLLGLFSITVTALHTYLIKAANGDGQAFVRKYMASTVFKFLFYILVLIVLLLYSDENKRAIILHFLFYYALFTVLEVGFLYSELQRMKASKR